MISAKGSTVMAIDLSHLQETGQVSCKRRHSQTQRHFAKSISTDGTEGKLTKNFQVFKVYKSFKLQWYIKVAVATEKMVFE